MFLSDRRDKTFRLDDTFDLALAGPAAIKSTQLLCLYQLRAQCHPSLSTRETCVTNVYFIQNWVAWSRLPVVIHLQFTVKGSWDIHYSLFNTVYISCHPPKNDIFMSKESLAWGIFRIQDSTLYMIVLQLFSESTEQICKVFTLLRWAAMNISVNKQRRSQLLWKRFE